MANSGSFLFKELDEAVLKQIARDYTASELAEYSLQSGGLFNTTYKLTLADGRRMILRVGPIRPELLMYYEKDMMAAEAFLFTAMEAAKIPCSHVVATGKVEDRDFMLVDYIDSIPLSAATLSEDQRQRVMAEITDALSRMHQMTGPAYGRVSEVLCGRGHPDWYSHVEYEVITLMDQGRACGSFTAAEAEHIISAVRHCKDALAEVDRPTLCHGDLWGGNILVKEADDGWHLAAIIDLDRALWGDIDFDLRCIWFICEDNYIKPRNDRNRRIRQAIYAMLYFIYEAHVWYLQYNNKIHADNSRRIVLQKATEILRDEIK
ncbi:MAG: aminoglycoside phosphotransferase family protein [Clostridia bacterium]|nr:aminoglycoside phosphotransferase family protein [Clostridia bacterium]